MAHTIQIWGNINFRDKEIEPFDKIEVRWGIDAAFRDNLSYKYIEIKDSSKFKKVIKTFESKIFINKDEALEFYNSLKKMPKSILKYSHGKLILLEGWDFKDAPKIINPDLFHGSSYRKI